MPSGKHGDLALFAQDRARRSRRCNSSAPTCAQRDLAEGPDLRLLVPIAAPACPSGPPAIPILHLVHTTTLQNVMPVSVQTAQMTFTAGDTVTCSVDVAGDYATVAWHGPPSDGSGTSFSTVIGPPKGSAPYDIRVQVGSGNPVVAHVSIGSQAVR